jgi:uncharacterized membrane protein YjjP (DUF1212 family)
MGNKIDSIEGKMGYSRLLALLGYVVLCVAFLLVLFGVIL